MFREKYKKIISLIVSGTLALSSSSMAFAAIDQAEPDSESTNEVLVIKQENVSEGDWAYTRVTETTPLSVDSPEPMTAVLDSDSGLYQITSEDNLYLEIVSDTAFQPMEKSIIYDTGDLRMVSEKYHLTETESKDMMSFMEQCPGNPIHVYAPRANETLGKYDEKKCRLVRITATDTQSAYEIEKGNTVVYAISTLGTKANIGSTITNAVLNLLGIDFGFRSDSSSYATKNERVTFQYLDFYELSSAYITRGISSYGTITLTTSTTCWVKQPNGDFVNEPIIGKLNGSFGSSETLASLAAKSVPYFEYYGDVGVSIRYTNYTTKFKIDQFNSVPAIQPKR